MSKKNNKPKLASSPPLKNPILDNKQKRSAKQPIVKKFKDHSNKWSFSFEYFKQIENFGLDVAKCDVKWFLSLIKRLRELNSKDVDEFRTDPKEKKNWRYHEINWEQTNIPVKRDDLDWLPTYYLGNPEEHPLLQFQISTSLGRVIGFWAIQNNKFHIVLLDPMHNMQPSKRFKYKVDKTNILSCDYSSLLHDIDKVKKNKTQNCENCGAFNLLEKIPLHGNRTNFFAAFVDDETAKRLNELNEAEFQDVLEWGLDELESMQ